MEYLETVDGDFIVAPEGGYEAVFDKSDLTGRIVNDSHLGGGANLPWLVFGLLGLVAGLVLGRR